MNAPIATTTRMPVMFIGHGSPLTAFEDNHFTHGWAALANAIPKPRAVLCISAHWYTRGSAVTAMLQPRTIHDFHGFPDALYQFHYPAPGDPLLVQRVSDLLSPVAVNQDQQWGFDHGAWAVLKHMYPCADVPIIQLSIDGTRDAQWHYDLGKRLAPLRDEGVLILGSGNVVHNLQLLHFAEPTAALPWAQQFNQYVRASLEAHDYHALVNYQQQRESAALSVPTSEHYDPLLYVLGASAATEPVSIVLDEIVLGSISMLSVKIG